MAGRITNSDDHLLPMLLGFLIFLIFFAFLLLCLLFLSFFLALSLSNIRIIGRSEDITRTKRTPYRLRILPTEMVMHGHFITEAPRPRTHITSSSSLLEEDDDEEDDDDEVDDDEDDRARQVLRDSLLLTVSLRRFLGPVLTSLMELQLAVFDMI